MLNCNKEVASAPILEDDASLEGNSAAEHAIKEEHGKGIHFGVLFFSNIYRMDWQGQ